MLHKAIMFLGAFRALVRNRICYCFNISTNYMCPSFTISHIGSEKVLYNKHVGINFRFTQSVYTVRVMLSSYLRRHRLLISTIIKYKHSVIMYSDFSLMVTWIRDQGSSYVLTSFGHIHLHQITLIYVSKSNQLLCYLIVICIIILTIGTIKKNCVPNFYIYIIHLTTNFSPKANLNPEVVM